MVCRAEQGSAEPAPGNIREIPFERFVLGHLDRVKIVAGINKCRALENTAVGRDGSVFAELKKLHAIGHGEPDIVTLRLFEEQSRQRENGICDRRGFDLRDDAIESPLVWKKTNGYGDRRDRNFRTMVALRGTIRSRGIWTRPPTSFIPLLAIVPAIRLARPASILLPVTISGTIGATLAGVRILAFEIGVVVSPRRLVRPGGQHFQVEQILGCSGRRHPLSFTPREREVNYP
jgi:hypothetical protein